MKKCYVEASQEWLKKKLELPQEAIIVGIVYVQRRDTFKFYVSNFGDETPECVVVERRGFFSCPSDKIDLDSEAIKRHG